MSRSRAEIAVILAAGVGRRLGVDGPKVLLAFEGKSLLQRHLEHLSAEGIGRVSITVGHLADRIRAEVRRLGYDGLVSFVDNPRYTEGSLVSLAVQGEALRSGAPILLMDGDVLCDRRMLARLLDSAIGNTLLVDRELDPGDEPVKVCFDAGDAIVDFRKVPEHPHVRHGESVGFFRFSPAVARALADRCDAYVAQGRTRVEYEEAIRDLLLDEPALFGAQDVTDLPWTEIDFEADVERARTVILPQLEP
ncbi:MAG: NTP transferase domain-containing protein [Caulobacterales bacterium]